VFQEYIPPRAGSMGDVVVEIKEAVATEGRAMAAHLVVLIVAFVGSCCVCN
jgi:hypothetical protein